MGARQSKRSVDITGTPTKGEVEGIGNEGKLEKIVDGVVSEKVAANGHVEGELQVCNLVKSCRKITIIRKVFPKSVCNIFNPI